MLPAHLHIEVARDCIVYKKKFSYCLLCQWCHAGIRWSCQANNLIFMNEVDSILELITWVRWKWCHQGKVAKWFFWVVLWRISCSNRIRIFGIINLLGRRAMWCLPVKVALPSLYRKERINTFRTVIYFIEPSFTSRRVWSFWSILTGFAQIPQCVWFDNVLTLYRTIRR
jgi:hypothetical protein